MKRALTRLNAGVGLLVVAVAFGLLTAALTFGYLGSTDGRAEPVASGVQVVVARADIRAGETLTTSTLELLEVPEDMLLEGALTSLAAAVNQVARYPLSAGEQVLRGRLVDAVNGDALAFAVPEGMRAVAVPFSPVLGAGGLVVPGDRVDVLVYTEYGNLFGPDEVVTPESAKSHATVLTLLQNVIVLAMDRSYTAPAGGAKDDTTRARATEATAQARTVTLAASPEDAQLLFLATQKGTLGLAMRRFGDGSEQVIEPEFRLRVSSDSGDAAFRVGR